MHHLRAYGLNIASASPLPGLPPATGEADVTVQWERLGTPPHWACRDGRYHGRSEEETLLVWGDLVTVSIRDGHTIAFDHAPDAHPYWVQQCILGPAMGILLHQRGQIALHASAVALDGRAAIFLGEKGGGKSTTAAGLAARRHGLITDDIAVIDASTGEARITGGIPRSKIREGSFLRNTEAGGKWSPPIAGGKIYWDPPHVEMTEGIQVGAIYVLDTADAESIEAIPRCDTLSTLEPHLYAPRFEGAVSTGIDFVARLIRTCARIDFFRLARTSDSSRFAHFLELIECHFAESMNMAVPPSTSQDSVRTAIANC